MTYSAHESQDLVQTAFIKVYLAWDRVTRHDVLDAYVRRTVFRTYLDHRKKPLSRELVTDVVEAATSMPDLSGPAADRMVLRQALAQVPPRQRATLVLRFWEDLSVEETAEILGCSVGTVKSQTARGLEVLRAQVRHIRIPVE